MTGRRSNLIVAACISLVIAGIITGLVGGVVVFRVFGTQGSEEAPGAGMLLLLSWGVLIPVGAAMGLVPANPYLEKVQTRLLVRNMRERSRTVVSKARSSHWPTSRLLVHLDPAPGPVGLQLYEKPV